jgi:cell division protein FtsQ
MTIDPRLIDRRREVAEDRARRNIGRLLRFLALMAVIGAVVWLFLSPYLSIDTVQVAGVKQSRAEEVLDEEGVGEGTPMILINADRIETLLEQDPWIAHADVEKSWPGSVVVRIDERVPGAWVKTSGGWARRATDGHALPSTGEPDATLARVELPSINDDEAVRSTVVLGAVEFAAALPERLRPVTVVRIGAAGELWAEVDGYQVRLGRPTEMTAKAVGLIAMLAQQPPKSSTITLIAATHPALTPAGTANSTQASQDKKSQTGGGVKDGKP